MSFRFIELETKDALAVLRLHKPPINALDETALQQLAQAVDQAEENAAVKVVIIASAIANVFCAGGDLKYWPRVYADRPEMISATGRRTFERIERMTKPSIAAIQGHVIGDGLSLALACDIRVASLRATFQLPEISYGFIPGWGTIGRLVEAVGTAHAAELLLLGERMSASRAQMIGLVSRIAVNGDVMDNAKSLAERLAAQPPMAVHYAKAALRGGMARSPDKLAVEVSSFAATWGSPEWAQGLERLLNTPRRDEEE